MEKIMRNKRTNGITLIALVITIIVLLILAGISISMLSGNNSFLTRAGSAKEQTERTQIIEKAQIDVLGTKAGNSGEITEEQFKNILNNYFSDVPSGDLPEDLSTLELTATNGGYKILASEILDKVSQDKNLVTITNEGTNNSIKFTPKANQNWYEWANDPDYTNDLDISSEYTEITLKELINQLYETTDGMDSWIAYYDRPTSFVFSTSLTENENWVGDEHLNSIIQPGKKYYITRVMY